MKPQSGPRVGSIHISDSKQIRNSWPITFHKVKTSVANATCQKQRSFFFKKKTNCGGGGGTDTASCRPEERPQVCRWATWTFTRGPGPLLSYWGWLQLDVRAASQMSASSWDWFLMLLQSALWVLASIFCLFQGFVGNGRCFPNHSRSRSSKGGT